MVMENEIRLGDIMDKLTPSDRVVIYNAASREPQQGLRLGSRRRERVPTGSGAGRTGN